MKLLVDTLVAVSLRQEIRLERPDRFHIGAISLYLYMHNSPGGTFKLSMERNSLLVFEKEFTSAMIKASLGTVHNYAHVFYPIIPTNPIQLENGLYELVLSSSGYAYAASSFLGWIRQHEDLGNKIDYVPINDSENPLSTRIKILNRGIL